MAPNRVHVVLLQIVCAFVVALAIGHPASAQPIKVDENSPVRSIRTVGEDGGMFYVVYCDDKRQGGVQVYEDPPKVCAGPPKECKSAWSVIQAAEYVCR